MRMNASTTWRDDWVIDPDPLAAANARHLPTGFSLTLRTHQLAAAQREGRPPFIIALYTDDSHHMIQWHAEKAGVSMSEWIDFLTNQARQLWFELGFALDATAVPPEPPPCKVRSWRKAWSAAERDDKLRTPDLIHSSGFAVRYDHGAEDGRTGWREAVPPGWEDRVAAVQAGLDETSFQRLSQEAAILWMEAGYFDGSPTKTAPPFGPDWRTLWHVEETLGEQWLVHVSGHAARPVFGCVDEDTTAWTLHGRDFRVDSAMLKKVGEPAWQRVKDQAWERCVELGFVRKVGSKVEPGVL